MKKLYIIYVEKKEVKLFKPRIRFAIGINLEVFKPLRFRKAGRVWCGGARETH